MKLSKLLATRQIIIQHANLANLAYSYLTLKRLADRVATARLQGRVTLCAADPAMADDGPPQPPSPEAPGYAAWHELVATDWEAVWGFYAGLFGWEKDHAMDMGPMGVYQIIRPGTPQQMGAMMTAPPSTPAPVWNYYFMVDSIDAAIGRLTTAGGKVVMGPSEVPGPMWVVQAIDNEGAMFSLVSSKP